MYIYRIYIYIGGERDYRGAADLAREAARLAADQRPRSQ